MLDRSRKSGVTGTKKVVLLSLFLAIAGILHIVEGWVPIPLPVPGVKLGLANVVSLIVIGVFGWRDAFYLGIARVCLGSLFAGTLMGPTFFMSLSGAVFSIGMMGWLHKKMNSIFSFQGISVAGAVVHNLAQIVAVAILTSSSSLLWYVPYLVLFAVPTGLVTGITTVYFFRKISKINL